MVMQKNKGRDKLVWDEMMRLLGERVKNPMLIAWDWEWERDEDTHVKSAYMILMSAGLVDWEGRITLAGVDYYRRETANPVLTWLKANGFAVTIAGCTIAVSVWGIVSG